MSKLATWMTCVLLAACASTTGGPPAPGSTAFTLWTPGLRDNAVLDTRYSGNIRSNPNCIGENSAPALAWANVPAGTKSIAIVVHDQQGRNGLGAVHWVAYGIDPALGGFAENEIGLPTTKVIAGRSTVNTPTYFGPCPPPNTGQHYYVFTAIATDLERGALPPDLAMAELLTRLDGGHAKGAASTVLRYGR